MEYKVYRHHSAEGVKDELVAECVFFSDAKAVLDNWHYAYVRNIKTDEIVAVRNMTLQDVKEAIR